MKYSNHWHIRRYCVRQNWLWGMWLSRLSCKRAPNRPVAIARSISTLQKIAARHARMGKVHLHEEQFDNALHSYCGRGDTAVHVNVFEATLPSLRCRVCDRKWFPHGQPDWHLKYAQAQAKSEAA